MSAEGSGIPEKDASDTSDAAEKAAQNDASGSFVRCPCTAMIVI